MTKYLNLDLLRYKKYQSLCDNWQLENFGCWGDAPDWATEALKKLGEMQDKYGHFESTRGKLQLPFDWEGEIPCFCIQGDNWEYKYFIKYKINRERVKRGLDELEYIII